MRPGAGGIRDGERVRSYDLSHQGAARGTVRAVNLGMTVDTAAGEQEGAWRSARKTLRCVGDGRMPRALVTRLTQERRAHLEQRRLHRTVRLMAVGAVLGHRLVFPEKRPAVFGVRQLVQVSLTVFFTNCAGAVEPCGEWQAVHAILPSRIG